MFTGVWGVAAVGCGCDRNIDRDKYMPVLVGITKAGDWYYYDGDVQNIENDSWWNESCRRAVISPDRSRHELVIIDNSTKPSNT